MIPGPILVSPAKPTNILAPSVTARGIVNITAVAVVEAQSTERDPTLFRAHSGARPRGHAPLLVVSPQTR